jgi:hypothetical protein
MEKVVSIRHLKDKQNDYAFWLTKTPAERIEAIEFLRLQYLALNKNAPQRLQRILRIVDKTSG